MNHPLINTKITQQHSSTAAQNMLPLIAMLWLTADLLSLTFTYKFIQINHIFLSAEALIFPLTYTMADITAEVYGFEAARKIIWLTFFFDFIFAFLAFCMVHIPSPTSNMQESYNLVFKDLLRGTAAEVLGVLSGIFINTYAISKLKIIMLGRYFWIRSVGCSLIGEAVLVIVSMPILFTGKINSHELITLMVYTFSYKIIFAIIAAIPASYAVTYIKKKENIKEDYSEEDPFALLMSSEY